MDKVVGYLLLIAGVFIIVMCGVNAYMVFTDQAQPVAIYKTSNSPQQIELPAPASGQPDIRAALQPILQNVISQSMGSNMEKPINLTLHLLLVGFLASVGFKLGELGVMLIRPVVVHMKEQVQEIGSRS